MNRGLSNLKDYRKTVPYIFLLIISILQWAVPSAFEYIGGPNLAFLPFLIFFGIHLYKKISKWIYLFAYIVFQYHFNLGAEFGFYPFACYLVLIVFFIETKKEALYQLLRNLMFFYLYGYIVLERLSDSAWNSGFGLWHFSHSVLFQGFLTVPDHVLFNYLSLLFEGVICLLFLLQAFRLASFLAISLHFVLLICTNITLWQLFLICYFLGAIMYKEYNLFYIKMRKIIKSFQTKRLKAQNSVE